MQLLDEIIELLSSTTPNLENALFKAQVLAHRLGELELKQWVDAELKGYLNQTSLPAYRVVPVTVLANLSNGVVRYTAQPLPILKLDARVREKIGTAHLVQSISVIEAWSKSESNLTIVIAPEYYGHMKQGLEPSFEIERAWGKHSVGAMLQVVVEVRSRLLELALQVADRIPQEPDPAKIKQVSQEAAVSEVFRNAVFGSNTTIVVGSGTIQGVVNSVAVGDQASLFRALRSRGVVEEDIVSLEAALAADGESKEVKSGKIGQAVGQWIAGMIGKAAKGTWEIGVATAGGVLAAAISAYYGFGGI